MKVVDLAVLSSTYEEGTHHFQFPLQCFPSSFGGCYRQSHGEHCAPLSAKPAPVSKTKSSLAGMLQVQVLVSPRLQEKHHGRVSEQK